MIWIRLIMTIVFVLLVIYYGMIVAQLGGYLKITNRRMEFGRLIVPFYYWIAPQSEKPKVKKKTVNERVFEGLKDKVETNDLNSTSIETKKEVAK